MMTSVFSTKQSENDIVVSSRCVSVTVRPGLSEQITRMEEGVEAQVQFAS